MKRSATANWKGTGKEGTGKLTTQSGVVKNKKYDFRSRFDDGTFTNPEELVADRYTMPDPILINLVVLNRYFYRRR